MTSEEKGFVDYIGSVFKWNSQNDIKDPVLKSSFEYITFNGCSQLHLVQCYGNGFQILNVEDSKNIHSIYTSRDDPIKFLQVLPEPEGKDEFKEYRPLLAIVTYEQDTIPGKVRLFSLFTKQYIRDFKMSGSDVYNISCNSRIFLIVLKDQIIGYDTCTFTKSLHTACFPFTNGSDAIALGPRWMAYPGNSPVPYQGNTSNESTLGEMSLQVAKKTLSGFYALGEAVSNYMNPEGNDQENQDMSYAGTIVIRDVVSKRVLIHFAAENEPISYLTFDPSGTLLVSTTLKGNYLNVFSLTPNMQGEPGIKSFQHLYRFYRGMTNAIIKDIQFSINSKWMAASSAHGTCHIFGLTPPRGPIGKEKEVIQANAMCRIHNGNSKMVGETKVYFHPLKNVKTECLYVTTCTGEMIYYRLDPGVEDVVDVAILSKWNLMRKSPYEDEDYHQETEKPIYSKLSLEDVQSKWISNIEIDTYQFDTPIWKNEQFKFKHVESDDLTRTVHIRKGDPIPIQYLNTTKVETSQPVPLKREEKREEIKEEKKEEKKPKSIVIPIKPIQNDHFSINDIGDLSPTLQDGFFEKDYFNKESNKEQEKSVMADLHSPIKDIQEEEEEEEEEEEVQGRNDREKDIEVEDEDEETPIKMD